MGLCWLAGLSYYAALWAENEWWVQEELEGFLDGESGVSMLGAVVGGSQDMPGKSSLGAWESNNSPSPPLGVERGKARTYTLRRTPFSSSSHEVALPPVSQNCFLWAWILFPVLCTKLWQSPAAEGLNPATD